MKNFKKNKGFSMVEVLISVLIISLGITAVSSAVYTAIKAGRSSQNKIVAIYLAEEGLEYARNYWYGAYKNGTDSSDGADALNNCMNGKVCVIKTEPLELVKSTGNCPTKIYFDENKGIYACNKVGNIETIFSREITAETIGSDGEVKVSVEIEWENHGDVETLVYEENLYPLNFLIP
jgi:prepilin-type N-terminal cleavage/methylation domain-containing protein